jgi:hypothetical protein
VNAVLLKPLPVAHPDRLVRIYEANSRFHFQDNVVAGGCFTLWQQQARSFLQMCLLQQTTYNLAGNGQMPEVVSSQHASWNTLAMLGARPALGRLFRSDDDRPQVSRRSYATLGARLSRAPAGEHAQRGLPQL